MRGKVIRFLAVTGAVLGTMFLAALLTTAVTGTENKVQAGDKALKGQNLIRFHVIANSDNERDQALKRKIRDLIVERVSPELAKAKTLAEARRIAEEHLGEMKEIAQEEVSNWGEDYPVTTQLGRFNFPVKTYGNLTLPAGNYEAVRVVIGKGQGANWWCVLFPPLCFVDVSRAMNTSEYQPLPIPQTANDSSAQREENEVVASGVYTGTELERQASPIVDEPRFEPERSAENNVAAIKETNVSTVKETNVKIRFKILEFFGWSFD